MLPFSLLMHWKCICQAIKRIDWLAWNFCFDALLFCRMLRNLFWEFCTLNSHPLRIKWMPKNYCDKRRSTKQKWNENVEKSGSSAESLIVLQNIRLMLFTSWKRSYDFCIAIFLNGISGLNTKSEKKRWANETARK